MRRSVEMHEVFGTWAIALNQDTQALWRAQP